MKDIFERSNLSPIELAKHIFTFKSIASNKNDFEAIKKQLTAPDKLARISQIITGLEQEDEFALLCRIMGTCESISKLQQTPIIDNGEVTPDFLVSFLPGCSVAGKSAKQINLKFNCFIEVKSTSKNCFKISKNDLEKRKAYARRFHIPLVFAVRFLTFQAHGIWVMIASDHLERIGRRVESNAVLNHINHVLLDNYALFPHPQLHIASYYDSQSEKMSIKHPRYGVLEKLVLLLPDKAPIEIEEKSAFLVKAFLNTFGFNEIKVLKNGSTTCVISSFGMQARILSDVLFKINHHIEDKDGNSSFDASRVVAQLDQKKPTFVTREMIEWLIYSLNEKEPIFYKLGLGEPTEQEKRLRSLCKKTG